MTENELMDHLRPDAALMKERIIELEQVIADVLEQFELLAKDPATNPWCVQMREALSPARPKQEDANG